MCQESTAQPLVEHGLHDLKVSGEEMIRVRDEAQLLGFGGCGYDCAKLHFWCKLIAVATEKKLWEIAIV